LKSNNIMLTGEGVAKIGDVGLAWVRSQGHNDFEFAQAVSSHAAPEAVLGEECTEKVRSGIVARA
jgi:serine/threonine protein kinase